MGMTISSTPTPWTPPALASSSPPTTPKAPAAGLGGTRPRGWTVPGAAPVVLPAVVPRARLAPGGELPPRTGVVPSLGPGAPIGNDRDTNRLGVRLSGGASLTVRYVGVSRLEPPLMAPDNGSAGTPLPGGPNDVQPDRVDVAVPIVRGRSFGLGVEARVGGQEVRAGVTARTGDPSQPGSATLSAALTSVERNVQGVFGADNQTSEAVVSGRYRLPGAPGTTIGFNAVRITGGEATRSRLDAPLVETAVGRGTLTAAPVTTFTDGAPTQFGVFAAYRPEKPEAVEALSVLVKASFTPGTGDFFVNAALRLNLP